MNNLLEEYEYLRNKDKQRVKMNPIKNRIVLGKLITDTKVDSELKYVWINRAVGQASNDNSTAILGLNASDNNEQKLTRNLTLNYRKLENQSTPFEIKNNDDLKKFLNDYKENYIIIKQNYPNLNNEENTTISKFDFKGKKIVYANSEIGNKVIGANKALQNLSSKDTEWIDKNVEDYIKYFYYKNNIETDENFTNSLNQMKELVKKIIIPTKFYKGNISKLRVEIKELIDNNFLPVFKFSNSISGYGVHYPKKEDGKYNVNEIMDVLENDEKFISYFVNALSKNGQKINNNYLIDSIKNEGIILQKFINGKDYAIGFYKPLNILNEKFALNIIDIDISEVITDGTAHYADILHYEDDFLNKILVGTAFEERSKLLYFSIEILIYLLYLNENIISNPTEFANVNFEDFGIQFMVDNSNGDIGLIEINGRTPSHNFNHFNILSTYGENFIKKLPTYNVLCTSSKSIDIKRFENKVSNKENIFIDKIYKETLKKFKNKCQIVAFQVMDKQLTIYYEYYLEENDEIQKIMNKVNNLYKEIIWQIIN